VVIQNKCTSIGAYAFADMPNLKEVYIPDSVNSIAQNAFDGCGRLMVYAGSDYIIRYAVDHEMVALTE